MTTFNVTKTDADWKAQLDDEQYRVLRLKGTEKPFSGKYYYENEAGIYCCAGCNNPLFKSDTKFDAGCGWPSFYEPITKDAVKENKDISYGMVRTEVVCGKCGGHLGHVFDDAPDQPTGLRYCINSVSINLDKKDGK
jgi:peptide-methionine (R)-S-oxide reductase